MYNDITKNHIILKSIHLSFRSESKNKNVSRESILLRIIAFSFFTGKRADYLILLFIVQNVINYFMVYLYNICTVKHVTYILKKNVYFSRKTPFYIFFNNIYDIEWKIYVIGVFIKY